MLSEQASPTLRSRYETGEQVDRGHAGSPAFGTVNLDGTVSGGSPNLNVDDLAGIGDIMSEAGNLKQELAQQMVRRRGPQKCMET